MTSSEGGERRDALAELGWVDGRTIDIVLRYADGALDRVPALIDELVALNPDVILTHTEKSRESSGQGNAHHPGGGRRGRRRGDGRACRR